MSEAFTGQITLMTCSQAPKNWAFCDGRLLQINSNQALFSLIGTTYGGDGRTTFGLPNLQGRCIVGAGGSYSQGQVGGETAHTLQIGEIPSHQHALNGDASTSASSNVTQPIGNALGNAQVMQANSSSVGQLFPYTAATGLTGQTLDKSSVGTTGGQPHQNMMPSLALNYFICLYGIYPARS